MNCRYIKYSTTCAICQIYIYNVKNKKCKIYKKYKNNAEHINNKNYINGKKNIEYKNNIFYKTKKGNEVFQAALKEVKFRNII